MFPRVTSLGIVVNDNCVLLEEREGKHSKGEGIYYRPLGGTIELGEKSDETLVREFNEELGVEIRIKHYISCLENIFMIDGNIGHEITQIYLAVFKDKNLYQKNFFNVTEGNKSTIAKWVSKEGIFAEKRVVYPNGLVELLKREI